MRLIDANALMEYCNNLKDKTIDANDIARFPTAVGWISVKDRLPELGKDVLVYAVGRIDGFIGESGIAICTRYTMRVFPSSPGHETWSSPWEYFHTDYEITHWMPLPEPPKESA